MGQLGNGSGGAATSPSPVTDGLGYAAITAGGGKFTCGRLGSGDGLCWGLNQAGQLGNQAAAACILVDQAGNQGTVACSPVPSAIVGDLRFTSLSADTQHTCGVTQTDGVYCWGFGDRGQLGDGTSGTNNLRATPVRVLGQP